MRKPLHLTIYSDFDLKALVDAEELIGTLTLEPKEAVAENSLESSIRELYRSWRDIKEYVRTETNMNKMAYATWIKPLEIAKAGANVVYLKHPKEELQDYIERKYFVYLMGATIDILDKAYAFEFISGDN